MKLNLRKKLLFSFLMTGLLPVFAIGGYLYNKSSTALEEEAISRLDSIRKLKAKAVQNYFQLLKNQALTFAHDEGVKTAMVSLSKGFESYLTEHAVSSEEVGRQKERVKDYYDSQFAREYEKINEKRVDTNAIFNLSEQGIALQHSYIVENKNPLGSKHLLNSADKKGLYNETHATHHPNFREYLQNFEFYDIFLVDAETGNVVYSVYKELDFGTSLKTGPYRDSGLGRVFQKAMALQSEGDVVMEDYSQYRPSYDGPAGFIATPIWTKGEKKGIVVFQISFDKINSITLENTGTEKTLETFLVGPDSKMRSDSLLDKEHHSVRASFRNPENGSFRAEHLSTVLSGKSYQSVAKNYLGHKAVISAAPLDVFGYTWAIETQIGVEEAFQTVDSMKIAFLIFIIFAATVVTLFAVWFAKTLAESLLSVTEGLRNEAITVGESSQVVASLSGKLSEATTEQAASLQQTVASIDEISAMISRNADSATESAKVSERSTIAAQKGKDKVEQMMESINAISSGNKEIIEQMQKSNQEISEIVKVIQEISQKTQVINDIVFQTKLLSFNASVEAARAGDHGKGFAVVAEEVGNLASMSGKAATEITDMLSRSVKRVTDIVDGTKGLMENLIKQSKDKVEFGTNTAKECAEALDEILSNVSSVNDLVREISTASKEQSSGVKEVNKAMSELDQVTQANTSVAHESSDTAKDLKSQADRLNSLVEELTILVNGENVKQDKPSSNGSGPTSLGKLYNLKESAKKPITKAEAPKLKKVSGIDFDAPQGNDPRFEDT
jgi:methyl-accepting chemotaxis protein